jgi:C4-dicarboxylate-specific signal transduction histidine kinase
MTQMNNITGMLIKTLEASTLFRKVSNEMVNELAQKMQVTSYKTGETIINKDDEGLTMFFIISGEVKIHDREHLLAILGKGEFFGEMSILDHEPRSMSVTATTETTTGSILRNDLFEVINRFPGMTVELIGFLSKRLRRLNKFMVEQLKNREKELEQLVAERTSALEKKNAELEEAIRKIRESQQQLIMQEKLASLGSLTAGVAHELHNPLNFVNNFTELSMEMMEEAITSGDANEIATANVTLRKNLDKILFHGQRAEGIIKSMIMHSNTGSGKVVISDINYLCEQSANMVSYATGNVSTGCPVTIEREYGPDLPELKIVPRDISKVLINILNNAFYEVNKKYISNVTGYEPKIFLKTFLLNNTILIEIIDNGDGVPEGYESRIFEPFFTTKPTGKGVGLGLSISNDILGAHGGKLTYERINSKNKSGGLSKFTIHLPVN